MKNTENRWEMLFMTKDQKERGDKQFVYQISCQSVIKHSKIAHKRPKRSNSTKIKMRLNTSKTATECWKPLGSVFRDQIPKQNLISEKNIFDQSRAKTH